MRKFIFIFVILIPVAFLYEFLDKQFEGSWWAVLVFFLILIFGRIGLYFYRRSKGIKDTYLDN